MDVWLSDEHGQDTNLCNSALIYFEKRHFVKHFVV